MGNNPSSNQNFTSDNTHFTLSEVNKLYQKFSAIAKESKEDSNSINRDQFIQALQIILPKEKDEFLDRLYDVFDKDKCGFLNFREFVSGLSILVRGTLKERIIFSFSLYDVDSSGFVDKAEMIQVISNMNKTLAKLYPNKQAKQEDVPKLVESIFKEFDLDKDEQLSITEFFQGAQKHPQLLSFFDIGLSEDQFLEETVRLVCINFSHWSNIAFEYVLRCSKKTDKVIMMYVHENPDLDKRPPLMKPENFLEQHKRTGEEKVELLKKYLERVHKKGMKGEIIFKQGNVKDELMNFLKIRPEIDEIVIGAKQRMTGSLGTYFVQNAPCSILIVK